MVDLFLYRKIVKLFKLQLKKRSDIGFRAELFIDVFILG